MVRISAGGASFEVEAIAFDKDGTLVDLDAAWAPAARRWVELGSAGDESLGDDLAKELGFDLIEGRLLPGGLLAVGTVDQVHSRTREVLAAHGLDPDAVDLRSAAAREASALAADEGNLAPIGDVAGTMARLRATGLRLAVVSSDDRSAVDAAIHALGIGSHLDTVVAGDEGIPAKPAPDPLLVAASRLQVSPGELLYVGDSWVDADAGRAARVAGVVLVGPGVPGETTIPVRSIEELSVG